MPRDGQPAAYNTVLSADGFQSAELFDVTLRDGTPLFVSDVPVTIGTQAYESDARDIGELRFSEGDNVDGMPLAFQNADGVFGLTDAEGVSPLDGAFVVRRRAVSVPDSNSWEVDTLGHFIVRDLEEVNQEVARFTCVPDYADPSKQMSAETVFLEELSPVAAEVAGVTTERGTGDGVDRGENRFGGFRGNYFDYLRDARLDRDFGPNLMLSQ
jgi:hypothetical protein